MMDSVAVKRRAATPLTAEKVTDSATDEHNLGIVTVEIEADIDENKAKIKELLSDTISVTLNPGAEDDLVVKKEPIYSENSASLPGITGEQPRPGPVGFEPGMFGGPPKKRKKEKKKHKHKHHKHKHGSKDKDGREKSREREKKHDLREETLSSLSSSPSPDKELDGSLAI